jgi:molybdate transport system substrate-binding protein
MGHIAEVWMLLGQRLAVVLVMGVVGWSCNRGDGGEGGRSLVRVAVAANFAATHQGLVREFELETGIVVETSVGATGYLYAQVANGAPYDVFLAADVDRPRRLEAEGLAVRGTRFTYALGRLALYAPQWDSVRAGDSELRTRPYRHLAIANPRTAPYGSAAREVIERWSLWNRLEPLIVRGENVGQAFQFVESGAAEVGFVALSQVLDRDRHSYWIVPDSLYTSIRQDAVLLRHGEGNVGAEAFLRFLQSDEGRQVIATTGYRLP